MNEQVKLLFQDDMEGSGVYINKIPGVRGPDGRQVSSGEPWWTKLLLWFLILFWQKMKEEVREEASVCSHSLYYMQH